MFRYLVKQLKNEMWSLQIGTLKEDFFRRYKFKKRPTLVSQQNCGFANFDENLLWSLIMFYLTAWEGEEDKDVEAAELADVQDRET